jgi:hypothetical protein
VFVLLAKILSFIENLNTQNTITPSGCKKIINKAKINLFIDDKMLVCINLNKE